MKLLEIYTETRNIGYYFEEAGFEILSLEYRNTDFTSQDIKKKIGNFGHPDVIWIAPDCSTYSMAGISHHRKKNESTGELDPISEYAKICDDKNKNLISLIDHIKPLYYFIENPRGGLRTMLFMKSLPRYTITYCQYGDDRMKPTDIWTNHPKPQFKPPCHRGDSCHVKAPRSSGKGTSSRRTKAERREIPKNLCWHIINLCKEIE